MDKQDTLRNLLFAAALFVLVLTVAPRLLTPPAPPPAATDTEKSHGSSAEGGGPAAPAAPGAAREASASVDETAPSGDGLSVVEADREQGVSLGADLSAGFDPKAPGPYRMQLELSNVGASVDTARMTDHAADVHDPARYVLLSPVVSPDGTMYRSLAVEKANVDDVDVRLDDKRWHVGSVEPYEVKRDGRIEEGEQVEFRIEIERGGAPLVRLTRRFRLPNQPVELQRHDLYSHITIENLSDEPRRVVLTYRGGVALPADGYRGGSRVLDVALAGEEGTISGRREYLGKLAERAERVVTLYTSSSKESPGRLAWAATGNTYFTCTVAPLGFDGSDIPANIASAEAVDLDGNDQTAEDVTVRLITMPATIEPAKRLTYAANLYLGEKEGEAFKHVPAYAARNYYFQISAGFGWCTFTWLVELMIWLLNGLHSLIPDYGVAILILVVIVRGLLHPITKKGQVNMVRMQQKMADFAPKQEEIRKKFAHDKARLQQETMKLYREHGINPAGQLAGCLPMFLQMPVWIALFLSLGNNVRMRHEGVFFLPWVSDLTAPDALYEFAGPLPLIGSSFNLLPILVAVFMYIQQKTQPKPKPNPNATEQQRMQQETMQKMMPLMSVVMLFIFYSMPAGLNVYIMFSSLFGWLEQTFVRKHIKEQEEAGTLTKPKQEPMKRKKRPGEMSFFEKLQKMAEDAQKAQPRKPEKKRSKR